MSANGNNSTAGYKRSGRAHSGRPGKKNTTGTMLEILDCIKQNTSYNKGVTFVDPVHFPSGKSFDGQIYNFVDSTELVGFSTSTTLTTFTALNFQLNNFGNASNFSGVFDQYRLRMVEVTLYPSVDQNPTGTTGLLHSAIDYDDSNALTSITQILDYQNVVITRGDEVQKRTFIPHAAVAAYAAAFTSFANETSPWIDAANLTVQHYGIKYANTASTSVNTFSVVVRAWFQFRGVR
jgi:hypothetical protein